MTACSTVPSMSGFIAFHPHDMSTSTPSGSHAARPTRFERQDTLDLVEQVVKENMENGSFQFSPMHDSLSPGAVPILQDLYSSYISSNMASKEDTRLMKYHSNQPPYIRPFTTVNQETHLPFQAKQEPMQYYYTEPSILSMTNDKPPGTHVFADSSTSSSFYSTESYQPFCQQFYSTPVTVSSSEAVLNVSGARKRSRSSASFEIADDYSGETTNSPSCSTGSKESYSIKSEYNDYSEYIPPAPTTAHCQPHSYTEVLEQETSLPYGVAQKSTFSTCSGGSSSSIRKRRRHGAPTRATIRSLEEAVNQCIQDNRQLEECSVKLQRWITQCQYLVNQARQETHHPPHC